MSDEFTSARRTLDGMDCLLVDAILAASFDWRELANRLLTAGRQIATRFEATAKNLPHAIYRMAHSTCHGDPAFAENLTTELNLRYQRNITALEQMKLADICEAAQTISIGSSESFASFLWAAATDQRCGVRKIAKYLVHRSITHFFSRADARRERESIHALNEMYGR